MYPFLSKETLGFDPTLINWAISGVLLFILFFIAFSLYRFITRPRSATSRRSQKARLAVTDAASIDDTYSLVLVRRDNVEHLLLIGGATDLVIENNIQMQQALHNNRIENKENRPIKEGPAVISEPSAPTQTKAPTPPKHPQAQEIAPPLAKPSAPISTQARSTQESSTQASLTQATNQPASLNPQKQPIAPTVAVENRISNKKEVNIEAPTSNARPQAEPITGHIIGAKSPVTTSTKQDKPTIDEIQQQSFVDDMDIMLNELSHEQNIKTT